MDQESPKPKWFFRKSTLIVTFLLVGPFVLPLVWGNPTFSRRKKVLLTVVIVLVTVVLLGLTAQALLELKKYYQTLQADIGRLPVY